MKFNGWGLSYEQSEEVKHFITARLLSQRASILAEVEGVIESLKTDERKVAVFGDWEARTYDEKQLVNAVLKEALSTLK